jgi:hypothetical protein
VSLTSRTLAIHACMVGALSFLSLAVAGFDDFLLVVQDCCTKGIYRSHLEHHVKAISRPSIDTSVNVFIYIKSSPPYNGRGHVTIRLHLH